MPDQALPRRSPKERLPKSHGWRKGSWEKLWSLLEDGQVKEAGKWCPFQ